MNFSNEFINECVLVLERLNQNDIESVVDVLAEIRDNKGRLFIIGSGGGAGHASHAVCDFRKVCNIEAYAPYDNVSELTARVNDEGWDVTIMNWLKVSQLKKEEGIAISSRSWR